MNGQGNGKLTVAVIGAGNGGQAVAAYLSMLGHEVRLYDINREKVEQLRQLGGITLQGRIEGFGRVACFTDNMAEAVAGAQMVMVTTVANAHADVARSMAPWVEEGQTVILNPGRTCGALVFRQALTAAGCHRRIYIGEAQTLVYACRLVENGKVNIIGIKDEVFLAALPRTDNAHVLKMARQLFPCFKQADSVLRTSLENIGAMLHPCVLLFNAATIERNEEFWFYRDMTEQVAAFIEKFDQERLAVGRAYGIELLSVRDWIRHAYKDTTGDTLCERMRNNPAYHDIKSPSTIFTRQLMEDIPTGVIPIMEMGAAAGVETPLLRSMVHVCEALLSRDFHAEGRTLKNLGLENRSKQNILKVINNGDSIS